MKLFSTPDFFALFALLVLTVAIPTEAAETMLKDKQWNHGSENCSTSSDLAIDVYSYTPTSFILRQSKCLSYEAPFMYVFIGSERALLVDTGATEDAAQFPLYESVRALIGDRELLVVHSHGHGDHRSADGQFRNFDDVVVIGTSKQDLIQGLSISQWPQGRGLIDLGNRELIVIPSPGHQEEAISIYDPQTQWLLSGDTLYPGYIYVKNWDNYRDSIERLSLFADTHEISAIMGAHIEALSKQGQYYAVGTVYQPEEAALPLAPDILTRINAQLQGMPKANEIELGQLRVIPMNYLQRRISDFGRMLN